jgi:hypothetical protein
MPKPKAVQPWPPRHEPRWVSKVEVDLQFGWSSSHLPRLTDAPPWISFGRALDRSWSEWWYQFALARAGLAPMPTIWTLPGLPAVAIPELPAPATPQIEAPPSVSTELPARRKPGRPPGSKNRSTPIREAAAGRESAPE